MTKVNKQIDFTDIRKGQAVRILGCFKQGEEFLKSQLTNIIEKAEQEEKKAMTTGSTPGKETVEKSEDDAMFAKADSPENKAKMEKVMKEFKEGKLKSSAGEKVTDRKQAIAIAMSEAGLNKATDIEDTTDRSFDPNEETKKSNLKKAYETLAI